MIVLTCFIVIIICAIILGNDAHARDKEERQSTFVDDPFHPGKQISQYDLLEQYRINHTLYCPHCYSINVEFAGQETRGVRAPKVETEIKLNLNPLRPLTLYNEKTKVVDKGSAGYVVKSWHCMNCGARFTK